MAAPTVTPWPVLRVTATALVGTWHCGAVRVTLPSRPRVLVSCNCSICRRYGTLWAYFRADRVRIEHARNGTRTYAWGARRLRVVRCARCGCITHWEATRPRPDSRMGVNVRLLETEAIEGIRVRRLDGADVDVPGLTKRRGCTAGAVGSGP